MRSAIRLTMSAGRYSCKKFRISCSIRRVFPPAANFSRGDVRPQNTSPDTHFLTMEASLRTISSDEWHCWLKIFCAWCTRPSDRLDLENKIFQEDKSKKFAPKPYLHLILGSAALQELHGLPMSCPKHFVKFFASRI